MLELATYRGLSEPLFRTHRMGDRYPVIDLFVELAGAPPELRPFFVAQVKATSLGYSAHHYPEVLMGRKS